MPNNQDETSYASLVRQVIRESPDPIPADEILHRVDNIRPVETRSPKNTIRSALAACRLIAHDGDGRYGWFPRMLKGSVVRAPLISSDLEAERIIIDQDVRDLLWPGFFSSDGELTDRNPVTVALPDGALTQLPLDFFGNGNWGTTGSTAFRSWLDSCNPRTGDHLIFEAVDAEARLYAVRFDDQESRNLISLYARTEEVEHAAEDHLWRRRAFGLDPNSLVRYLLGAGYYKDPLPPEPISLIWNRAYPAHLIGDDLIENRSRKRSKPGKLFQLKITLLDINPPVWRRIVVPGNTTLAILHYIIQLAMGWTNSHLHQFIIDEQYYSDPEFQLDLEFDDIKDESSVRIGSILTGQSPGFLYEYDFGDNWRHVITVEQVSQPGPDDDFPRCIGGERACPPEDVGGSFGYENFLETISNPFHDEYSTTLEWIGGYFDPERLSTGRINRLLKRFMSTAG